MSRILVVGLLCCAAWAQSPRTWVEKDLATWATPIAGIHGRPGHFSEAEYYKAPIDNYRTYAVYHPKREPAGYWDEIRKKKPQPLIESKPSRSKAEWIAAGKQVWDEWDVPIFRLYDAESIAWARSAEAIDKSKTFVRPDGVLYGYRWAVTPQGIGLTINECSSCHMRHNEDGTPFPGPGFNRRIGGAIEKMIDAFLERAFEGDSPPMAFYRQFATPWVKDDIHERIKTMSKAEMEEVFAAQVPGVIDRINGSPFYLTKVPDLIGLRERKYLDHSGTHRHRGSGDLMRYAALVAFSDSMDFGSHRMFTDKQRYIPYRAPDEALYALAEYIYSLAPPPNPNAFDGRAAAGQKIFAREGCGGCHTPPLYTNNKLTPVDGFQPPKEHFQMLDILNIPVGTDPSLALKTRKGTGYYKVPSLKGVWYRGLYLHDGAVATLEDLFDPARLRPEYVPTGFKGYRVKSRAVPGHEFGLKLGEADKRNLIAFLRTL